MTQLSRWRRGLRVWLVEVGELSWQKWRSRDVSGIIHVVGSFSTPYPTCFPQPMHCFSVFNLGLPVWAKQGHVVNPGHMFWIHSMTVVLALDLNDLKHWTINQATSCQEIILQSVSHGHDCYNYPMSPDKQCAETLCHPANGVIISSHMLILTILKFTYNFII